jgi:hypothetical protein
LAPVPPATCLAVVPFEREVSQVKSWCPRPITEPEGASNKPINRSERRQVPPLAAINEIYRHRDERSAIETETIHCNILSRNLR